MASSTPEINDKDCINILLLGETGVGKSTFINSFVNYICYRDFSVAADNDPLCIIPTKFTLYTHDGKQKIVSLGTDQNEFTDVGVSATQGTKSYVFPLGDGKHYLRIIDTPGIGDTRGIDQDKENFENILSFLSGFDCLHSICILLKPNSSRLTVMFEFCLKQLLSRLEKSAANNISFIFTNSRSTFYRPSDTNPILEKLLQKIKDKPPHIHIPLEAHNTFYLDNEAYRFLIACKNDIKFSSEEVNEFSGSWVKSVKECIRLIFYIIGNEKQRALKPHKIQDTLSINEARRIIFMLSKPLADISQLIQDNKQLLNKHKDKLENNKKHRKKLEGELYIPCVKLREIELGQPVTVCTSDKCSTIITVEDKKMRDYSQRCHDPCYLKNVPKEIIGTPELAACRAMDSTGRCLKCECDFKIHMHIYYMTERYEDKIEVEAIRDELAKAKNDNEKYETYMKLLEQTITELDFEHSQITKSLAKFAHFIKNSTILPFNDTVKEYIEYLVNREEHLGPDGNKDLIAHYRDMLLQYEEEKRLLEGAMNMSSDSSGQIDTEKVMSTVQDLFDLKHNGAQLKSLYEKQQKCCTQEHKKNEEYFHSNTNNTSFLTYQNKKPESSAPKSNNEASRSQKLSKENKTEKNNKKNKRPTDPPPEGLGRISAIVKGIVNMLITEQKDNVQPSLEEEFYIPKNMIDYAYGHQGENIKRVYNINGISKVEISAETGRIKISGKSPDAIKQGRLILEYTAKAFNLFGEVFTNNDHDTRECLDQIKNRYGLIKIEIGEPTKEYLPILCVGNIVDIAEAMAYLEPQVTVGKEYNQLGHFPEFNKQATPKMEHNPEFNYSSNSDDYNIKRQSDEYQKLSTTRKQFPGAGYGKNNSANLDKVSRGFANLNLRPNGVSMPKTSAKFIKQQYDYDNQTPYEQSTFTTNDPMLYRDQIPGCEEFNSANLEKVGRGFANLNLRPNDLSRPKQPAKFSGQQNDFDYQVRPSSYAKHKQSAYTTNDSMQYGEQITDYEGINTANIAEVGRGFVNMNLMSKDLSKSKQPAKFTGQHDYDDQVLSKSSVKIKQTTKNSVQHSDQISRKFATFLLKSNGEKLKQVLEKSGLDSIKINEQNPYSAEVVQIQYTGKKEQIEQAIHIIGFIEMFDKTNNGAVHRRIQEQTFSKKFPLEEQEKCITEEMEVPKHLMTYSKGSDGQNLDKAKTVEGVIDITNEENKFIISATSKESIRAAKSILECIEEDIPISPEILQSLSSNNAIIADIQEKTGAVKLELKVPNKKSPFELEIIKKVSELSNHRSFNSPHVSSKSVEPLSLPRQLVASLINIDQVWLKSIMRVTKISEIKIVGDEEYKYPTLHVVLKGEPESVSKTKMLIDQLNQLNEQMDIKEAESIDIKTITIKLEEVDCDQPIVKAIGTTNSVSEIKKYLATLKRFSKATTSEDLQRCTREIELRKDLFYEAVQMNLEKARSIPDVPKIKVLNNKFIIEGKETAVEEACAILELQEKKIFIPESVYALFLENYKILEEMRNSTGLIDVNIVGPKMKSPEDIVFIQGIFHQLARVDFKQIEKCKAPELFMNLPRRFVMKLLEDNMKIIRYVVDISRVKEIKIVGDNDGHKFPTVYVIVIGGEDEITKAKYILEMLESSNNLVLRDEAAAEMCTITNTSVIPEEGDEMPCVIISGTKNAIIDATNYLSRLSGSIKYNATNKFDEASNKLMDKDGVEGVDNPTGFNREKDV